MAMLHLQAEANRKSKACLYRAWVTDVEDSSIRRVLDRGDKESALQILRVVADVEVCKQHLEDWNQIPC